MDSKTENNFAYIDGAKEFVRKEKPPMETKHHKDLFREN